MSNNKRSFGEVTFDDSSYSAYSDVSSVTTYDSYRSMKRPCPVAVEYMLLNQSYGCFGFSRQAREELDRRGFRGNPECDRSNPIILGLFDEKGSVWCSDNGACLVKVAFPAGYGQWTTTTNFDGWETLHMDFEWAFNRGIRYILDTEDATIEDVRSLETKINRVKEHWHVVRRWNFE